MVPSVVVRERSQSAASLSSAVSIIPAWNPSMLHDPRYVPTAAPRSVPVTTLPGCPTFARSDGATAVIGFSSTSCMICR